MSDEAAVNLTVDNVEFAALLLATPDSGARAALVAAAVVELLPDSACILYLLDTSSSGPSWRPVAVAGDVALAAVAAGTRLIEPLLSGFEEPLVYSGAELRREDFAHLQVARTVASLAYLSLQQGGELVGAVELISFAADLSAADLDALAPVLRMGLPAVLGAKESETQRHDLLDSVNRLTQLYDLEKSLNSTLDLDRVMALIPRKTLPMMGCQAVHLWLFDGGTLTLTATAGTDATVRVGMTQAPGEGYVADMAEEGAPLLIAGPADERLQSRNAGSSTPVWTAMLAPLMQDESEVGVLEAVNKNGGGPFNEDDVFFLQSISETVSSALKNATLMFAERKLAILEALVHVSSEITSTLRLDRLLQIIVNSPQNVLPFERCAIALDNRGRLQLKAVSGMSSIPVGDPQVGPLHELVRWLSAQPTALHIRQQDDTAAGDIPNAVIGHFETTGYRALYSLPLTDDQGRLGVLMYESSDPNFLELAHTEMIKILAGQATVAIRNALLYREVPLISLLEPLMQKKQALLRTSRGRRWGFGVACVASLLFLAFCPLPMRLTGDATVAPQHLVTIAAPVDGTVVSVAAHEGQIVHAGEILGSMNDLQWRTELSSAEARSQAALLTMQADLAQGAAQAGADRAQMEFLRAEAERARSRIDIAQLRSPISGVVMTPYLQNAAGEHLDVGAAFAQVLDLSSAVVDIAIAQADAALLRPGDAAAIKLDSYPQRSWHGVVAIVSPEAQAGDGQRTFSARVVLPNADATLRAGMTGRAKVFLGYRPAGYVLLRRPSLWIWQLLWNWFGW
ncbi:MAG: efflux transporter periplasmic adaptor subunit [Acidobacteriaceae bacterium]|nr:efflux transporter periplasmic adaptor subunit [Acidobacteriaceae bacterium]